MGNESVSGPGMSTTPPVGTVVCVVLPSQPKVVVAEVASPELHKISERIYTKRLVDRAHAFIDRGRREGDRRGMNVRAKTLQMNEFAMVVVWTNRIQTPVCPLTVVYGMGSRVGKG